MFLADFHTHSRFGGGRLPLRSLVDLFGSRGFGALAVTDSLVNDRTLPGKASELLGRGVGKRNHAIYRERLGAERERAWKKYRMLLVPGFETASGVLALGVEEYLDPSLPLPALSAAIRAHGGLAIAAQPLTLWNRREELRPHFDAWEVAAGALLREDVKTSGFPLVAGSNLRRAEDIRSWKTVLECERSLPTVLDAIRLQRLSFTFYNDVQLIPPPARANLLRHAALQA